MSNKLVIGERKKFAALRKMIGKEVRVVDNGNWIGPVLDVVDHENFLILKNNSTVKVSVYDVRSL